jgi:hypothetical protein
MPLAGRPPLGRRAFLLGAPATLWIGCSSSGGTAPDPEPTPPTPVGYDDIADVIYRPGATDEGLLTLLNARAVTRTSAEPVITAPTEGAELAASMTFTYQAGATARRRIQRGGARDWSLPGWLTLERSAFAHGAPMNGDAFFVAFSTTGHPKFMRIFTQDMSYVPTDAEWQHLATAGDTITLTVTRAIYEENRLTEDGGPYVGKPLHFSVVP